MEENTTEVVQQVAPAIDYSNPDQVMILIQEQGTDIGMKVVAALLIFLVGRWLARMVTKAVRRAMAKTGMEDTLEKFLCNILNALLMVVVLIATIGALGVETTSLLAVLAAAGLAIGLALQGSLSNFASGVLIIMFRPYKVGDYIDVAGVNGTVDEVQIFTTVLITPDNKQVIVPNSQVMNGIITNFSAHDTRRVDLVVGCGYDADIDQVFKVIREVLAADERILQDPAPTVDLNALADSSVNFNVRPWVKKEDYWGVYNGVTEQVKRRFDAAGISIPFPQRDVHVYNHDSDD
jgi:small conductance mechanosensitive channel